MKRFLEILRSLMLWGLSWLHFLIVVPALIALAIILDPRKHDYLQRGLCRRIAFFSGAKVLVKEEPGFDRTRTSFFMVNHVNLFDPFITTKQKGSGLGLALVAKLVGDHGGTIECESHPRRTTFRVLMPLETPRVSSPA